MTLLKKISYFALTLLGFISLAAICAVAFIDYSPPKRDRYLIPSGYAGWLCIKYGVAGMPALKLEDGFRLVEFPLTGYVETSSEAMGGKMKDEFFYAGNEGRSSVDMAVEMGGGYSTSYPTGEHIYKFWVSRDAMKDFQNHVESKPNNCGPFEEYKSSARFNSTMHTDAQLSKKAKR